MTQAPPAPPRAAAGPCRAALSLFTVIPVRAGREITGPAAAAALRWLPVTGSLVAVPAAGVLAAAEAGNGSPLRRLLAAVLALAVLALLTGGLHLDGLADTADGLGSRRERAEALAIMRRPDIGPFGVAALLFVLLAQVAALAAVAPGWPAVLALAAAAVTGRAGVLLAAGPGFPAARPDGLGALVAGTASGLARAVAVAAPLAAATAAGAAAGGPVLALRCAGAVLAGLLAAVVLAGLARRRLGGLTGDVYGALIEVSAMVVLLVLALSG
jgi:adenosylcobinamide-GDP ribazoletransferase